MKNSSPRKLLIAGGILAAVLTSSLLVTRHGVGGRLEPVESHHIAGHSAGAHSLHQHPAAAETTHDHSSPAAGRVADITALADAWNRVDSPLHNGDRSRPIELEPVPGRKVAFFVDQSVQKGDHHWYAVGRTGGEASVVVATRVGSVDVLVVNDPTTGESYSILSEDGRAEIIPTLDAGCGVVAAQDAPAAGGLHYSSISDFQDDFAVPPSSTRITIAGFYSPRLAAQMGSNAQQRILAQLEAGVQLLNVALHRARADAHAELVGAQVIDWDPSNGGTLTDLKLSPTLAGFRTAVAAATEQGKVIYTADLLVGIPDGKSTEFAGGAYLGGRHSVIFPASLSGLTFPHEIGHNFGMDHNREDAVINSPSGYNFGLRESRTSPKVYTIMAYRLAEHTRVLAFSDPEFHFQNVPLGMANREDNARVARENVKKASARTEGDYSFVGDNWLINQSTRGYIGTGADVMIAGFVVGGNNPKQVVIRGLGPTLMKYGVQGALGDPRLEIYSGSTKIAENDNWASGERVSELSSAGMMPEHEKDAAVLVTLNPGAYTAILSGVNDAKGVGLVEAYAVDGKQQKLSPLASVNGTFGSRIETWAPGISPNIYLAGARGERDVLAVVHDDDRVGYTIYLGGVSARREAMVPLRHHPQKALIKGTMPHLSDSSTVWLGRVRPTEYLYLWGPDGIRNHSAEMHSFEPGKVVDAAPSSRFVNLSTRALIGVGEKSLIAGVVVSGNSPKSFLFRALGEHLRQYGINNPAQKLIVSVYRSDTLVDQFTATRTADAVALKARGLMTTHPSDVAGFVTLRPGVYTIVLSAPTDADGGIGLVELYEVE